MRNCYCQPSRALKAEVRRMKTKLSLICNTGRRLLKNKEAAAAYYRNNSGKSGCLFYT